ncbi:MAG TPA: aminoglycoside 6-adenylyltransferase [Candidatus Mediterraneibacter excrementipullorum]|nr:aminoglycoside 6-adenylyltransferase [Candidatus Mediterraneibacter excrementipullorum]
MRAESEMYDIIIRTAESDDRVLAAYLKGSRANPNAHKDICQDFDIMYVVKETESFRTDLSWMEPFGKVILKQEQDDAFGYGERFKIQDHYDETYSWLLLFEDGNRIDIGVETLEAVQKGSNRNKLFVPLLDKTGCLPQLPPPTDEEFFTYPQSYEEGFMKYMEFLRSQK